MSIHYKYLKLFLFFYFRVYQDLKNAKYLNSFIQVDKYIKVCKISAFDLKLLYSNWKTFCLPLSQIMSLSFLLSMHCLYVKMQNLNFVTFKKSSLQFTCITLGRSAKPTFMIFQHHNDTTDGPNCYNIVNTNQANSCTNCHYLGASPDVLISTLSVLPGTRRSHTLLMILPTKRMGEEKPIRVRAIEIDRPSVCSFCVCDIKLSFQWFKLFSLNDLNSF